MYRIGMSTIGQSPRDDLVPDMEQAFSSPVEVVQRGALDGLTAHEIAGLGPDSGESGIVARLRDGSSVLLSHAKILPRMQTAVDELTAAGSEFVVILCGADWSALASQRLVVNPGVLFPAIVSGLARGRRLGIIKPSAGQVEQERDRYTTMGIVAAVTSASPYTGAARIDAARQAARSLRDAQVDLVWMTCVGMDEPMRAVVAETTRRPVILARSLLARVVDALLPPR
jgi:protein AroM